jgi:hypothetical protein
VAIYFETFVHPLEDEKMRTVSLILTTISLSLFPLGKATSNQPSLPIFNWKKPITFRVYLEKGNIFCKEFLVLFKRLNCSPGEKCPQHVSRQKKVDTKNQTIAEFNVHVKDKFVEVGNLSRRGLNLKCYTKEQRGVLSFSFYLYSSKGKKFHLLQGAALVYSVKKSTLPKEKSRRFRFYTKIFRIFHKAVRKDIFPWFKKPQKPVPRPSL